MNKNTKYSLIRAFMLVFVASFSSHALAGDLTVYAYKHYKLKGKLYKKFEEKTGIKVKVVFGGASSIMDKLAKAKDADVLLMADVGRLNQAKQQGLLKSIQAKALLDKVPEKYRDPDNSWFGFSKRARVIYYNPKNVNPKLIGDTYESLADSRWQKKVLVRSSSNIYNQSFLAAMVANNGADKAKKWVASMEQNLANNPPKGSDRGQAIAAADAKGKIAIANHYYMGKMLNNNKNPAQQAAAKKLAMKFVKFKDGGTHVNLSAAAVLKTSKNVENAVKFLQFLYTEYSQKLMVEINYEYPVIDSVELTPLVKSWGLPQQEDDIPLYYLGKFHTQAKDILSASNWK